MRILGIFLFLYFLNMTMNVSLDILQGTPLRHSLQNLLHPFGVNIGSSIVTILILISIWIVNELAFHVQERKQLKNK